MGKVALEFNNRLVASGFRLTPQRQQVYEVLMQKRDHPTADEVFIRAKQEMPDISMATVYNCLDALVKSGIVRQVNLERAATRYCPNMKEHTHFHCDECGRMYDIDYHSEACQHEVEIPDGFKVSHLELSIRGLCPACVSKKEDNKLMGATV